MTTTTDEPPGVVNGRPLTWLRIEGLAVHPPRPKGPCNHPAIGGSDDQNHAARHDKT